MVGTDGDPSANDDGWRRFLAFIYPLREDESPYRIYRDVNAMFATTCWRVMTQALELQGAFYGEPGTWMATRYTQLFEIWADAKRLDWPMLYKRRRLAMVIRQWVEEEPSPYIAAELRRSPEWDRLVEYMRRPGHLILAPDDRDNPEYLYSASIYLEQAGLPSNPATARHFIAQVNGDTEPYPARGVLVTTLCYMTPPYDTEMPQPQLVRFAHPSETIIAGTTEWMPGPLLERVNEVVRKHQQFLEEHEAAPYEPTSKETSYRARRARQDATPPHLDFDYVEHAVRTIPPSLIPKLQRNDPRFTAHLKKSSNVVRARRRRAGLPIALPKEWRDEVYRRITAKSEGYIARSPET